MSKPVSLAVFGASPLFDRPIANGQRFFPAWAQYEAMFRDIFERQYYTNHGPLTQELERRLAERLGVSHAMCVTNEFIGLVSAGQALGVHGNVVVPAHSFVATPQSLCWTEARPLLCDVDPKTGMMTAELVAPLLSQHPVSAILAVNPWGDACDVQGLQALADQHGIPLYVDSAHGFGCAIAGRPVGSFGAIEVISLHSDNVLGACEGGVVCTQDDELAAYIRNTRSSYGMGLPVPVPKTGNGRMSEAQAAIALFNLDHYSEYQQHNERVFGMFRTGLAGISGLEVRVPSGVSHSNYQNLICLIDEAAFGLRRDDLWQILRAENLLAGKGFEPSLHRTFAASGASQVSSLSHTDDYCSRTIELPMNRALTEPDAARLIDLLARVQLNAGVIRQRFAEAA
jgi:dTDP-4-amino-4,6-dideoxygalactose transaminase